MLTLLQNVAVLGILGLAMAIVVIGRGIDISLIAALAVPAGPGAADGAGRPLAAGFACWPPCLLAIGFGLVNGWLIAYAEVPSLFATLASGLLLAGLGQAALFQLDVVQWSPGMDGFERLGQGSILGIPTSIVDVRASPASWCRSSCARPAGAPISTRSATIPSPRASPAFRPGRSSCCNMCSPR